MGKYETKIIINIDEELIREWKELWNKAENATVLNSYEWFLSSKETCRINYYEIYACYKDNRLFAVLPLFITKCFGIKVAKPIGYKFAGTPFLVEKYEKNFFRYFFGDIVQKRNLYIPKVDSEAARILQQLFPKMFFSLMSVNPYLDRNKNPEIFLSTSNHKNVRRIMKKNSDQLRYEMHNNNLMNYLKIIFDIEQKSDKKLHNKDLFSKIENRDFFINLVKYCSQFIQINLLYYASVPIAYTFNFRYKDTFMGYQTSHLDSYRKLYPGKTILVYDLESLNESSTNIFDLGGGISSYKLEFAPTYYFLYDLYYSKNFLIILWWKSINLARRIKQIILPIKYTRDHEFLFKKLK